PLHNRSRRGASSSRRGSRGAWTAGRRRAGPGSRPSGRRSRVPRRQVGRVDERELEALVPLRLEAIEVDDRRTGDVERPGELAPDVLRYDHNPISVVARPVDEVACGVELLGREEDDPATRVEDLAGMH